MAKVSVIVPCYGVEKYLNRCMESIINQKLNDIEIILVDDKSPDNVPLMCDEWAQKDNRIKVIHKEYNEGLGYARNTGLECASGEFVAFVDSDDYIDSEMYQKLYDAAENSNSDVVFCGFKNERSDGGWHHSNEIKETSVWEGTQIQSFLLDMVACDASEKQERKYAMSVWHAIYKRSIIKDNDIKFLSEREVGSEDIPFQIDFLQKAHKVVYIPDAMYYYCNNGTSLTATFNPKKFTRFKCLYHVLKDKLAGIPDGDVRAARFFVGYIRSQLRHLCASDYPKIQNIKKIVNDPIWEKIQILYTSNSISNNYHKLTYNLILSRSINSLYLLFRIIALF